MTWNGCIVFIQNNPNNFNEFFGTFFKVFQTFIIIALDIKNLLNFGNECVIDDFIIHQMNFSVNKEDTK